MQDDRMKQYRLTYPDTTLGYQRMHRAMCASPDAVWVRGPVKQLNGAPPARPSSRPMTVMWAIVQTEHGDAFRAQVQPLTWEQLAPEDELDRPTKEHA
jgi:hypothetical protein